MRLSALAALGFILGLVFLAGCRPASASDLPATVMPETGLLETAPPTGTPTQAVKAPATPAPVRVEPTSIPPTPGPTACSPDLCTYTDRLILQRPVVPPGRDAIDITYRFGSTQDGTRDPHHGVEFLNSFGTPVLAAGPGLVVVAGDDRQTFFGPYSYFYGNLVVVEHHFPGMGETVYTLYGHLSELSVRTADRVDTGQMIGKVGMTGVATGSHLHFEVRVGENTYRSSRNPELYLAPRLDENGQAGGALAGRILDPQGNFLQVESIVLEHLAWPDGPAVERIYLETYMEKALIGLPPYQESFAAGDLPAGWYRLRYVQNGMQEHILQVFPGQLTVVTYQPGQP